MKNKIHCFVNHIYPRKLYVVITDSTLFLNQNLENIEDGGQILQEDFDKNKAITFRCASKINGDYGVCVAFCKKKYMTIREMAHEALHVSSAFHKDLGMSMGFNIGEDETCAYITGWAADCMNRVKTNNFDYEKI